MQGTIVRCYTFDGSLGLVVGCSLGFLLGFYSQAFNLADVYHYSLPTWTSSNRISNGSQSSLDHRNLTMHGINDSLSNLTTRVRVFCWVLTTGRYHRSRADQVLATWGRHCDRLVFVSDAPDKLLPVWNFNTSSSYEHLAAKTMHAFDRIYATHRHKYDWFLKVDDDTFVVVENLRYMLSAENTSTPVVFGRLLKTREKNDQDFHSGGAGYVLSRGALERFGQRPPGACPTNAGGEDVEMAKCLAKLGVVTRDSHDSLGRSRFHCFQPGAYISGSYPQWYYELTKGKVQKGVESMSDSSITFHYITKEKMQELYFLIYRLHLYGRVVNELRLNESKEQTKLISPLR